MGYFEIHPCTVDDAASIARNNMSAYWTDPNWAMIWDIPLDTLIEDAGRRYGHNLLKDRHIQRHQKAVDPETGELVGYSRWIMPHSHQDAWPEARVAEVTPSEAKKLAQMWSSAKSQPNSKYDVLDIPIYARMHELKAGNNYMVLDYLAVIPSRMRQGIGSLLVESGVREAERLGLDIFVLAMPTGCPTYKKAGFTLVDEIHQDMAAFGVNRDYSFYFFTKVHKKV